MCAVRVECDGVKAVFILAHAQARLRARVAIDEAPDGYMVSISEPNRTLEQNAAQWPYLAGFAKQLQLCVNGVMEWVTDEDWKNVLTACYKGEMRMAVFDGTVIMLPQPTRKMGKKVFSTWLEFLIAIAAKSGVEPIYKTARRDPMEAK